MSHQFRMNLAVDGLDGGEVELGQSPDDEAHLVITVTQTSVDMGDTVSRPTARLTVSADALSEALDTITGRRRRNATRKAAATNAE